MKSIVTQTKHSSEIHHSNSRIGSSNMHQMRNSAMFARAGLVNKKLIFLIIFTRPYNIFIFGTNVIIYRNVQINNYLS